MGVALFRLLPLVLFLLPAPFREYYLSSSSSSTKATNNHVDAAGGGGELDDLHPIVLLPGVSCSNLEARLTEAYQPSVPRCGAMKGKGWFGLWKNASDLLAHDYVPCFEEQMRLLYDPAADDYRNLPGVETRVPGFGSATGFQHKNPLKSDLCLAKLRHALERIGYRDGETLFGAPYDMRHAPPLVPGNTSPVYYSRYFKQLMELIEDVARKPGTEKKKKVILFGHSFGGMLALEFVRSAPPSWRDRYVKHLFVAAPTLLQQGFVAPVQYLASGPDMLFVPTATSLALRPMWWSFESALLFLPSPEVFGRTPLVVTRQRNYSTYDLEDLLLAIGFGDDGVQAFRQRLHRAGAQNFQQAPPMVPLTCFNGVGVKTPLRLVYWDHDFDLPPRIVYGDGDGKINRIGMLAFDAEMRRDPAQRRRYKSIKFDKAHHETVLTDPWALHRVVQEILEANRVSAKTRVN